jgi:uncharacterized protein (UPF0218 family)
MKNILYLFVFLLAGNAVTAQVIKLKKEIVYVGDTPTFSFIKKAMGNELYVYKLNTKEEFVKMVVDNNNTESKVDDSKKIIFNQQKTTIISKNFRSRNYEFLITLLLEEKVIDIKGDVNLENLNRFKAKYDDNDVNKTMR